MDLLVPPGALCRNDFETKLKKTHVFREAAKRSFFFSVDSPLGPLAPCPLGLVEKELFVRLKIAGNGF